MNIESLKIFCLVVEEKSISRAAKLSYITQPAVTRQMQQLEEFYGLSLFYRANNEVNVLEPGEALYRVAKTIIQDYEHSVELMETYKDNHKFTLTVGASLTIGEYLLPKLFEAFKKEYPNGSLYLKTDSTTDILKKIEQNEVHIGIVEGEIPETKLEVDIFMEDELILIVGPSHSWSKRKEGVYLKEIVNEHLIRRQSESELRIRVEKELAQHEIIDKLESYFEVETTQAIKSAVEAGTGISFISRMAVEKEIAIGDLVEIPLKDATITRNIWMLKKNRRYPHIGSDKFFHFLQKVK